MVKTQLLIQLIFFVSFSLCLSPSPGCNQDLPNQPKPGKRRRIRVNYDDRYVGSVRRNYFIQVPTGFDNTEPAPLVFDYHGWGDSARRKARTSTWRELGNTEKFLVVWPDGMGDVSGILGIFGLKSFNCSRTEGFYGPTCDTVRSNWDFKYRCYKSCPLCSSTSSCDWTSCHDDVGFLKYMMDTVTTKYCIDMDSIHLSGFSNGGMFAWYIASFEPDIGIATINPNGASPLIGFGEPPASSKISIIDIHGLTDSIVPITSEYSQGTGPQDSWIAFDGFYYDNKENLMNRWATLSGCWKWQRRYRTDADGIDGFKCWKKMFCPRGVDIVRCTGDHGHVYSTQSDKTASMRVVWEFMKAHSLKT